MRYCVYQHHESSSMWIAEMPVENQGDLVDLVKEDLSISEASKILAEFHTKKDLIVVKKDPELFLQGKFLFTPPVDILANAIETSEKEILTWSRTFDDKIQSMLLWKDKVLNHLLKR